MREIYTRFVYFRGSSSTLKDFRPLGRLDGKGQRKPPVSCRLRRGEGSGGEGGPRERKTQNKS